MKVIFLKAGKFRNDIGVIEVTEKDIEKEAVFEVADKQAVYFENSGAVKFMNNSVKKKPDADEFKEESKPKKVATKKK